MINEITEVEKFINMCHNKSKHHYKNSLSSRKWENILNFTNTLVVATGSLVIPLLAVNDISSINVSIASNIFIFLGVIISSLKSNYGFITLTYQHTHLSNEFADLENEFHNFQRRNYDNNELEKLILQFQSINSRSNIQSVKDCSPYICCCYNN